MALTPEQEWLWRAELEKLSVAQVRSDLEHNKISSAYVHVTSQWLADKDREAESREAASRREQMEIARAAAAEAARASVAAERASLAVERQAKAAERQATAAERANRRATIALVIAIISMIVTVSGMIIVHLDTIRHGG